MTPLCLYYHRYGAGKNKVTLVTNLYGGVGG